MATSSSSSPSSSSSSSSFTRPFPPPSLLHVPVGYIIEQLRNLAIHYWNKPASADCTIVVPVPHARRPAARTTSLLQPCTPSYASHDQDSSGIGGRVTEPVVTPRTMPRIVLKAHLDYLMANSTLLRGVFTGASPLDLITSTNASPGILRDTTKSSAGRITVPANRLPRLLPSPSDHPILYLPVPDPTSIHVLLHWMYFGTEDPLKDALDKGTVQWEGIARNAEYLGLPTEIKVFLGRYYKTWLHPEGGRFDAYLEFEDDESDDEDNQSDADSDDTAYDTCLSDLDEDEHKGFDDLDFDEFDDESTAAAESIADDDVGRVDDLDDVLGGSRGRSRQTRCLSASYATDDPPLTLSENRRWSA